MASPSQEQIRAQIDKLLPEYAPSGKFARGEQDQLKYKFSKTKTKPNPTIDKHKGGRI